METTTTSLIGQTMVKAFIVHTPLATSRHRNLHEPRIAEHTPLHAQGVMQQLRRDFRRKKTAAPMRRAAGGALAALRRQ
jgi:hypothetical protein